MRTGVTKVKMSEPATSSPSPVVFLSGPWKMFFLFFILAGAVIFYGPLKELLIFSFHNDNLSHIPLIPLISGYFFWRKRKKIFPAAGHSYFLGALAVLLSAAPYLIGKSQVGVLNENDQLFFMALSAVIFCFGGFLLLFGLDAFKAASFPLLFLFFMVPIPSFILNKAIFFLQTGSTYGADQIFKLTGIPFLHKGFAFSFPGLGIYVAHECSGIRSSISLLIMAVIMGHVFLARWPGRFLALLVAIPIAAVKNSIRIATLSILSLYVDRGFMYGKLHRDGGIVFFLIGLALLGLIIRLLKRFEGPSRR